MALPLAMLALVVVAALIVAVFASARLELRMGRNAMYAAQAAGAADVGIGSVVSGWSGLGLEALAPGVALTLPGASLPDRTEYEAVVLRLNERLYRIGVTGFRRDADGLALATRQVELVVRLADSADSGAVVPLMRGWVPAF